jgi:hypothetical protein
MVFQNKNDVILEKYNLKYKNVLPLLIKISDCIFRRHKIFNISSKLSCMPFYIFGSGRNGSTLLSSMLNQHSQIMIPPEQWVLYEMILKYKLLNFLEWKDIVNLLLGLFSNDQSNEGWDTNFQALYDKLYRLDKRDRNLQKFIDEIYLYHANEKGIKYKIWGDKSPINTIYAKYIYSIYPKSKFVFLFRDGRDVISSYMKVQKYDINFAAWKWNYSVKMYKWIRKKVRPEQLILIKYEDLIRDPDNVLIRIMNFLDLHYESSMLDFQKSLDYLGVKDLEHHKKLSNNLNKNGIEIWKERLNEQESKKLNSLISTNLKYLNYT